MKNACFLNLFTAYFKPFIFCTSFLPHLAIAQVSIQWNSGSKIALANNLNLPLALCGGLATPQYSYADINGDDIQDLFVYDSYSQRQFWLDGAQEFATSHVISRTFPINQWALLRDFNCDGVPDLFTGQNGSILAYAGDYFDNQLSFTLEPTQLQSTYNLSTNAFTANIFVNPIDIPVIQDIDGDGDLDILAMASTGDRVEHHLNVSQENNFGCSLQFELASGCYGYFREEDDNASITLGLDKCPLTVVNRPSLKHSGTTLFLDTLSHTLLLGELEYDSIKAISLVKGSQADSAVSAGIFPQENPLALKWFNAVYHAQVDGKQSYIVAPNAATGFQTEKAVRLYKTSANGKPSLASDNFLISDMLDYGNEARLSAVTVDGQERIAVLSDIVTKDSTYQQITTLPINNTTTTQCTIPVPSSISIQDLAFFKEGSAVFVNTTGSLFKAEFDISTCTIDFDNAAALMSETDHINLGAGAHLTLTDINKDGSEDIIAGLKDGSMQLWLGAANGSFTAYTREWNQIQFPTSTYLNPSIQQFESSQVLWLAQFSGRTQGFLLSSKEPYIQPGPLANIEGNGFLGLTPSLIFLSGTEIIAGLKSGGIITGSLENFNLFNANEIVVYPNPTSNIIRVNQNDTFTAELYHTTGKKMQTFAAFNGLEGISLNVKTGLYFLQLTNSLGTQRLVKIIVDASE